MNIALIGAVLIFSMIMLILLGVPITFALGAASILGRIVEGGFANIPYEISVQRMVYGINSFNWVAVPMFLMLGQLMNSTGLTERIFDFALKVVGHIKGGLAHVNVFASLIFSGMSGSASADAAGLGKILVKAMSDSGYGRVYSATVTAASATLGPILPPSIPAIIYATIAEVSILRVFLAAVVPAIMLAIVMLIMCTYYAHKYGYDKRPRAKLPEVYHSGKRAILPLLTPLILMFGMYSGIFTASEAGAIGVAYALIITIFVIRTLSIKQLISDINATVIDSGIILVMIAMIGFYGWALTRYRIPVMIFDLIMEITTSPVLIIIFINIVLLIAGALMSTSPALLILVPLLLPIVDGLGIDRTLFGVMCILNLVMGSMTPPVGNVLIILSRVANVPYEKLCISLIPWYIPYVIVIVLILVFEPITLWLPRVLGF